MKKLFLLSFMFLSFAVIFSNCKKDETTEGPSIAFANNVSSFVIDFATMADPYTISIVATVTADGEIKDFTVKKKDGNLASSTVPITGAFSGKTTFVETFNIQFASTDVYPIQIIFSVTDKNDKGQEKIYTVTKKVVTGFAKTKAGQFYHVAGLLKGAYDLDADAEVASAGTASTKSMVNTDVAGDPFTGSWESDAANGTMYVKANSYDYTNATLATAITAYVAGTPSASVDDPVANDIYIARKDTLTYYVIKITAVDPAFSTGTGGNTGKITFGYKKN
jgi:hypothetical protein